jgi:hypothetical protein
METITSNVQKHDMFTEKISRLSKLVKALKDENKPILTVRDLILILLYAQKSKPIKSRIMLFKETFLLYNEILQKYKEQLIIQNPKFFSYKYGPYSYEIAEALKQLYWSGLISIEGKKNTKKETFKLTKRGLEEAERIFKRLPPALQEEIIKMRIGWDQLGIDGILRYVYAKYKGYTDKSKIKDKYKWVIWGGKG